MRKTYQIIIEGLRYLACIQVLATLCMFVRAWIGSDVTALLIALLFMLSAVLSIALIVLCKYYIIVLDLKAKVFQELQRNRKLQEQITLNSVEMIKKTAKSVRPSNN